MNLDSAVMSKYGWRAYSNRHSGGGEVTVKRITPKFAAALLFGLLLSGSAWPHGHGFPRHHTHVGIAIGIPLVAAPWYYPAPQIYTNPPVAALPQAYIEMNSRQQQPSGSWWYYCHDPEGYYPYIKECPRGWERVDPQPADLR